ncbi:MAG TPA: LPS-assembly protein LptD [Casimicrobiaceae bacterium]|nr:LPS-assembly protein LptD [Casimicrobiaceae bacterium]
MKLPAGPAVAWAALYGLSCAQMAGAEPLSLKLSRDIDVLVPKPTTPSALVTPPASGSTRALAGGEPETRGALFLRADRLEGSETRVTAEGNVELRTHRETVLADKLSYAIPEQTIYGDGDVVLRRGFDWITGPQLQYKRDTETGFFRGPRFFVAEANAHGDAKEIRFNGPDHYEAVDASYTTCVAPNPDWYLRGEQLEVDNLRKVGTARNVSVHFLDVPVLYAPWLTFPLSNERKSGFLTPTLGSTGVRGFEISTPYYLNLAPNYDATLTPRYMTKRGLQIGAQFRYLLGDDTPPLGVAVGEMNAEFLPHDRSTGENRYALAWKHNEQFTPWLGGFVNLNKVSDDKYFADFADRIAVTSQKTLPREAGLVATHGPWSFLARAQSFQTLQDPEAPVVPPYNRLPQVLASLSDTDWLGLTWSGNGEYARFTQDQLAPTGERFVLYPTAAFHRQGPAWFFTARAGVHMREYMLDRTTPALPERHPSYAIPITSLDAGLVFERDLTVLGTPLTQTLEPRAFYVYIPYKNQTEAPVFDTALDDFNFSQLFAENRYIGNDRIGDANQLTLALTSRYLDRETGAERLRLAVGQRFYFQDQRVSLNEPLRSASTSDFLVGAEGRLSEAWSLASLLQYNLDSSDVERFNVGVRYTPAPGRALNATWRYTRALADPAGGFEQIKQIDLSGQWPVSDRWTLIGRWNYSIADRKTLEAVAGIEYNADCWVLRIVGQRLTTTTQQATTSVFVQLELNGLARVGTSPLELLRRSVPGYLPTNDPSLRDRDRRLDPLPEF